MCSQWVSVWLQVGNIPSSWISMTRTGSQPLQPWSSSVARLQPITVLSIGMCVTCSESACTSFVVQLTLLYMCGVCTYVHFVPITVCSLPVCHAAVCEGVELYWKCIMRCFMDIVHSEAIFNPIYHGRKCRPDTLPFVCAEISLQCMGIYIHRNAEIVCTSIPYLWLRAGQAHWSGICSCVPYA